MANRDLFGDLKNDAGALFSAAALTADDYSESKKPGNVEWFGIAVDLGTVSGTSPTLDIKVEFSLDGGTTWLAYPGTDNASTQAAVVQLTATGTACEYWRNILPGDFSTNPLIRFHFDTGGTSPSFAFDSAKFIGVYRRA